MATPIPFPFPLPFTHSLAPSAHLLHCNDSLLRCLLLFFCCFTAVGFVCLWVVFAVCVCVFGSVECMCVCVRLLSPASFLCFTTFFLGDHKTMTRRRQQRRIFFFYSHKSVSSHFRLLFSNEWAIFTLCTLHKTQFRSVMAYFLLYLYL